MVTGDQFEMVLRQGLSEGRAAARDNQVGCWCKSRYYSLLQEAGRLEEEKDKN